MREPSRFQLWYGRNEPPVETREFRAGPLVAQLEGIDLRYVRLGDVELVRRLFVAVRDTAWGTVQPTISGLEVRADSDSFRVAFEAFHETAELRFRWRGEYAGTSGGTLECALDGVAESDFDYNRIGFCVLHPRENAGRAYVSTPDGPGTLPALVGVQRVEEGRLHPLFPSYDRLEIEAADGIWARFEFEGDLFEMEDQRNWTDASFKTYSTPLALGFPHRATEGQRIAQTVRLSLSAADGRPSRRAHERIRVEVGTRLGLGLPRIGLGLSSDGGSPSEREATLLRSLGPDHLRADLEPSADGWQAELARAVETARALDAALELALFLGEDPDAELATLAAADVPATERVLVFRRGEAVTDSRWVRLARDRLSAAARGAIFAGGTDGWFVELNRGRPRLEGLDALVYSVTATVHADDDSSVRETPAAQGDTVRSARAFSGDRPILVSPVTIRPRSWPFGELEGVGGLPFQVDPRQCALYGAGWTLASAKNLAEAGAASITYFETTGWRGVLETERGAPLPEQFPSRPGAVFPLYHVLADLGEWRGGELVGTRSSAPLALDALAVRTDRGFHLLVASLTPTEQRCEIGPLPARHVSVRTLDETNAVAAGDDPESFRGRADTRDAPEGKLELELAPYAVARLDL